MLSRRGIRLSDHDSSDGRSRRIPAHDAATAIWQVSLSGRSQYDIGNDSVGWERTPLTAEF